MAFTVISNIFKDGEYLPNQFILSADFGFGCAGGRRIFNGRDGQQARRASPSHAMTRMRLPARASGTGWWLTSPRISPNWPMARAA